MRGREDRKVYVHVDDLLIVGKSEAVHQLKTDHAEYTVVYTEGKQHSHNELDITTTRSHRAVVS